MSIRIEIGERYVVTSDSFQFILHEKKRAESGFYRYLSTAQ